MITFKPSIATFFPPLLVFKTLSHYQLYLVSLPPLHVYQETAHNNQQGADEINDGIGKCHLF